MNLNEIIVTYISIFIDNCLESKKHLRFADDLLEITVENEKLLSIDPKNITLLEQEELSHRIANPDNQEVLNLTPFENISKLESEISVKRVNHLGINYICHDFSKEVKLFKDLLKGTEFNLYEEKSDFSEQKWLFIGNLRNWKYPLFELVPTMPKSKMDKWTQHFQIDLDTDKTIEELRELTSTYITKDFFDYELNIPNYGVVMGLGELANVYGTKIYLAFGTNLRNTKYHREMNLNII